MSKIKELEKQIINNSIKPLGGGLPQKFNDLDKLPYIFSKPKALGKDMYQLSVNLVDINGFYYPAEIFTGEVKSYSSRADLVLKPKYAKYGYDGILSSNTRKKKFENMVTTKFYTIETKKMLILDNDILTDNDFMNFSE